MRKILLVGLYLLTANVNGALHPRDLDGDIYNGHEGVYDDVLDITWLADARIVLTNDFGYGSNLLFDGRMGGTTQGLIIQAMNAYNGGAGYLGVNTWRMPQTAPLSGSTPWNLNVTYDGSSDQSYQLSAPVDSTYNPNGQSPGFTGAELAYHFYINFGARGSTWGTGGTITGGLPGPDFGIDTATKPENVSLFTNIQNSNYWIGNFVAPGSQMIFGIHDGIQSYGDIYVSGNMSHLWPVAPGDVGEPLVLPENIPVLPVWATVALAALLILSRKLQTDRGQ